MRTLHYHDIEYRYNSTKTLKEISHDLCRHDSAAPQSAMRFENQRGLNLFLAPGNTIVIADLIKKLGTQMNFQSENQC